MGEIEEFDDAIEAGLLKPSVVSAPFRWFGGKGRSLSYILPLLPRKRVYVEPCCGAGWVFWSLPRPYPVEVLNDIDGRIINVFRCLQDEALFRRLRHKLLCTPYARAELERALEIGESDDPVERAWSFLVRVNLMINGDLTGGLGSWSRSFVSGRGMSRQASAWATRLSLLKYYHNRLMRVQLDNRDAFEVIDYWDSDDTLFYIDPPYVLGTRKNKNIYFEEWSDEKHAELIERLLKVRGAVVLSGYENPIYERLAQVGWRKIVRRKVCDAVVRSRGLSDKKASVAHFRVDAVWVKPDRGASRGLGL